MSTAKKIQNNMLLKTKAFQRGRGDCADAGCVAPIGLVIVMSIAFFIAGFLLRALVILLLLMLHGVQGDLGTGFKLSVLPA